MSVLAIKGHLTRGKEVIEILEMLGGKNRHEYVTDSDCFGFFIGNETTNKTIYYDWLYNFHDEDVIFTLEEFLQKFPYKVGDRVIVESKESCGKVICMRWQDCTLFTGDNDGAVVYTVKLDTEEEITFLAEHLQPYKEQELVSDIEFREALEKTVNECLFPESDKYYVEIPSGYKFAGIDDKQQVVFEKIKPQYPNTYEECSLINGCDNRIPLKIIGEFTRLINARNAYWKIAGEQMGLGKPWSPSKNDNVYCIFRLKGEIVKDNFVFGDSLILEFPTEEMRDAFFENFRHLIELCKELL